MAEERNTPSDRGAHRGADDDGPLVIETLRAAASLAAERLGGTKAGDDYFPALKSELGEDEYRRLSASIAELLQVALNLGAVVGYGIAATAPRQKADAGTWPERALAFVGLEKPDGALAANQTQNRPVSRASVELAVIWPAGRGSSRVALPESHSGR